MGQLLQLNRVDVSLAPRKAAPAKTGRRPSWLELSRAVELLEGKIQTLKLAQGRLEREAERLSEDIRSLLSIVKPDC